MNETDTATYEVELDTSGLNCPLPILKTKKVLNTMQSGQRLHVIATDPAARIDFEAFCAQTGHMLVSQREEGSVFHFVLRRR